MQLVCRSGAKKCKMRIDKFIVNSILGGAYIGFGCAAALIAGDASWYTENAPGPIKVLAGAVFPIGLIVIALTGAELWTSTIFVRPSPLPFTHPSANLCGCVVHHCGFARTPRYGTGRRQNLVPLFLRQSGRHPLLLLPDLRLRRRVQFSLRTGPHGHVRRWKGADTRMASDLPEWHWLYVHTLTRPRPTSTI